MGARETLSGAGLCGLNGLVLALALFAWDYLRFRYLSEDFWAYPLEGLCIAAFAAGGHYLWKTFVRPMAGERLLQPVSRIPFWLMAGGMGCVAGLLLAKKFGLVPIYERPIRSFFLHGAAAGLILQGGFDLLMRRK
jgi:hypothetical protein